MITRVLVAAVLLGAVMVAGPAQSADQSPEVRWVEGTLGKMTLEEKVGQLFVVGAAGKSVRDPDDAAVKQNRATYGVDNFEQLISKYHLGGIIYFGQNLADPDQIVGLSNGIQEVEMNQRVPIPALISTDQEGGTVQLIRSPAAVFPGNMALGAIGDPKLGEEAASVMGQELRAMGVNVDLAPVVDVNTNQQNQADGSRAYSDTTKVVSKFADRQVRGFQGKKTDGVAATAKHFPGIGSVTIHTDNGPSVSNRTLEELRRYDLPPFAAAIRAGAKQVMTGFVTLPNVDPAKLPAAFSSRIVTGLLRNELKFGGVIITDALQAGAIKKLDPPLTPAQVAVMAINAGNDQLLEQADLDPAFNGVLQAVQSGQISGARIDDSVRRILHEKWQLGLVKDPYEDPENVARVVGTKDHVALADQLSKSAITLVKNNANVLPLPKRSGKKVLVTGYVTSTLACVDTVTNALEAKGVQATAFPAGFDPDDAHIKDAVAKAKDADVVVVTTYNAFRPTNQQVLVRALVATGKPVVVLAMGAPYDIAYFPDVAGFLGVYNYYTTSLDAAVDVLVGDVNPSGKLSVTINQPPPSTVVLYRYGHGLHYRD